MSIKSASPPQIADVHHGALLECGNRGRRRARAEPWVIVPDSRARTPWAAEGTLPGSPHPPGRQQRLGGGFALAVMAHGLKGRIFRDMPGGPAVHAHGTHVDELHCAFGLCQLGALVGSCPGSPCNTMRRSLLFRAWRSGHLPGVAEPDFVLPARTLQIYHCERYPRLLKVRGQFVPNIAARPAMMIFFMSRSSLTPPAASPGLCHIRRMTFKYPGYKIAPRRPAKPQPRTGRGSQPAGQPQQCRPHDGTRHPGQHGDGTCAPCPAAGSVIEQQMSDGQKGGHDGQVRRRCVQPPPPPALFRSMNRLDVSPKRIMQ